MTAPVDPFPVAALLRSAVEAHCSRTGASHREIADAAGLSRSALSRALREGSARETQPATVRAVLRALGLRVALVPG